MNIPTRTGRYKTPTAEFKFTQGLIQILATDLKGQYLNNLIEVVIGHPARSGTFLKPLRALERPVVALGIAPACPTISTGDFFDFSNAKLARYAGIPPYGNAAHLATHFFNHAAITWLKSWSSYSLNRFERRVFRTGLTCGFICHWIWMFQRRPFSLASRNGMFLTCFRFGEN